MGNEAICSVEYDGEHSEAKALLETDELIVRAPLRLRIPFSDMKDVAADDEHLRIRWASHRLSLALGAHAKKWAEKIRNPKSLVEKLGIKTGQRVSIAGKLEDSFAGELTARGADVSRRVRGDSDIIFFTVSSRRDLERVPTLKKSLATGGALWIVRPKGNADISELDVIAAGRAAALVDVKVARFSATHTAQKFVSRGRDRVR